MTIRFALNIFRWHIGALDIHLDIDQAAHEQQFVDRGVKTMSRWWARHMAS